MKKFSEFNDNYIDIKRSLNTQDGGHLLKLHKHLYKKDYDVMNPKAGRPHLIEKILKHKSMKYYSSYYNISEKLR